jgi:hypothetical protein
MVDETVKQPRLGERRSWSEAERRREGAHYYLTALNGDGDFREALGSFFRGLAGAGIDPDDDDTWALAASMAPGALGDGEVTDLRLEPAALIAGEARPFISRWRLPRSLGNAIFPGDWAILRESYSHWYHLDRPASEPLSEDQRALFRREEPAWYRDGLRERPGEDGKPGAPTLYEEDLWKRLGFKAPGLLRAHRRDWPRLVLPGELYLAPDYGEFERGRFMPTVSIKGEDFEVRFDPERDDYDDLKAAFAAYQKRQQDEFERQVLEILRLAKEQGLTERPARYKSWRAAEAVYLRAVRGLAWKQIARELGCDLSQIRDDASRMAGLLGVEL